MTATHPPAQHPLAACDERAMIQIEMTDGRTLAGAYTSRAGFHFVHCAGGDLPPIGEVVGPILAEDVVGVRVLKTRDEILSEASYKLRGDRVLGSEPVTREDFQYRLEVIARAITASEADWRREMQLHCQFKDVADRIGLSAGKRAWMLYAARWAKRSNAPPTLSDRWPDDVASPSCLARPRPEDFDPDPAVTTQAAARSGTRPRRSKVHRQHAPGLHNGRLPGPHHAPGRSALG